jgi:hypothetical protein
MDYAAMEDERKALLLQLQQAGAAAGLDAAIAAKAAAKAAAARSAGPLLLKAKVPSRCDTAAAVGTGSITGAFGAGLAGGLARSGSSSTSCPQQQLTLTLVLTNTGKAALKVRAGCTIVCWAAQAACTHTAPTHTRVPTAGAGGERACAAPAGAAGGPAAAAAAARVAASLAQLSANHPSDSAADAQQLCCTHQLASQQRC